MALTQAAKFILARFDPEGALTALTEFNIFSELACVGVEGVAMEGKVIGDGEGLIDGRGGNDGGCQVRFVGSGAMLMGMATLSFGFWFLLGFHLFL